MRNKFLSGISLVGLMLVAYAPVAKADLGIASFQALPKGQNAVGQWNVIVQSTTTTNLWSVKVWADTVDLPNPNDTVKHVQVSFLGADDNPLNPLNIISSSNTITGTTNIAWSTPILDPTYIEFVKGSSTADALNNSNVFTGALYVTDSSLIKYAVVELRDTQKDWLGQAAVTPEPASLAMLLPGLLPVGLLLNRRKKT